MRKVQDYECRYYQENYQFLYFHLKEIIIRLNKMKSVQNIMYRYPQQETQINEPQMFLNPVIPYTNLLRSNSRKRKRQLFPIIVVVWFIKKVRRSIKKRRTRQKILQQWYTTEHSYYLDLWVMANFVKRPMSEKGIVTIEQLLTLFPELEGMMKLSQMMLTVLDKAIKTRNPHKISLCREINGFVNGYKIYGGYFNNHSKSSKLLAQLSITKKQQMKEIETSMQAQYSIKMPKKQTMTIKDCMQQPFYRLFKYVLLIKQYMKKLPKWYTDYESAQRCHNSFHEINNYYNEQISRIQEKEKKQKLVAIFGDHYHYLEDVPLLQEFSATTVFYEVRIYLFPDIVAVTKIQKQLGVQRQEKYGIYELDEFSYVGIQDDLKYYKNIVMVVSKQLCVHLLFNDYNTTVEFYKCLYKIIRDIRVREYQNRMSNQAHTHIINSKSGLQINETTNKPYMQSQVIVQISGCEIRPLSALSNDSIYETRIMIPFYHEDEPSFNKNQQFFPLTKKQSMRNSYKSDNSSSSTKSKKSQKLLTAYPDQQPIQEQLNRPYLQTVCQVLQINFSTLQQIYKQLKLAHPQIPQIDPNLNQSSYSVKGKRKTKSHECRKLFIEQFFNYVFRNSSIMATPFWLVSKLRINQQIWTYVTERNKQIREESVPGIVLLKQLRVNYGFNHCALCNRAKIQSIEDFQHYRNFYSERTDHRTNKQLARYCFNFFNLMRIKFLSLPNNSFNTVERILAYYHYRQGRLDYPFLVHNSNDKILKVIRIHLASIDNKYEQICIDSKSTVGQVIGEIGVLYGMNSCFDYDLMSKQQQKYRILDRDEYIFDVVKNINLDYMECQPNRQRLRNSKQSSGLLSTLKSWSSKFFQSTQQPTKIYFLKSTYLHKSIQMKSFACNPKKKQLQIQKIFWLVKKGLMKVNQRQLIQFGALFYCLRELSRIQTFGYSNMSTKLLEKVICDQYFHLFSYEEEYKREFANMINAEKLMLMYNGKNKQYIYHKLLQLSFQRQYYKSYFIEVELKQQPSNGGWTIQQSQQLPSSVGLSNKKNQLSSAYILGINYKQLIIKPKQPSSTSVTTTLPIEDVQLQVSVFSIYVEYANEGQKISWRFDGKMLNHFYSLYHKYRTVLACFPYFMAD